MVDAKVRQAEVPFEITLIAAPLTALLFKSFLSVFLLKGESSGG